MTGKGSGVSGTSRLGADGRSNWGVDAFVTASCDVVEVLTHIHLLSSPDTITPAMAAQPVIFAT
jgi:hypothetical protein